MCDEGSRMQDWILGRSSVENPDDIRVTGIRHVEKMYETLLTNEVCAKQLSLAVLPRSCR